MSVKITREISAVSIFCVIISVMLLIICIGFGTTNAQLENDLKQARKELRDTSIKDRDYKRVQELCMIAVAYEENCEMIADSLTIHDVETAVKWDSALYMWRNLLELRYGQ